MSNPEGPKVQAPQIQVQLDEQIAQGAYSNLVLMNHNENEFVFDFAFVQPSVPLAKVRSRIITSPGHAKRLLLALQRNVDAYESRFGKIEVSGDEPNVVH